MKKYVIFLAFLFSFQFAFSQSHTIRLSFSGEDAATHNPLPLEGVLIQNITTGCDTTVYGDAPSLLLSVSLGISEQKFSTSEPFVLMPPAPNPFTGKSGLRIFLNQGGTIHLNLLNVQGKVIAEYKNDFKAGLLRFEIETSVNSFLLLTVTNGSVSRSVKLINRGYGTGNNSITCLGTDDPVYLKSTFPASGFSFRQGDQLLFTSIKSSYNDKIIYDSPAKDSAYSFRLSAIVPVKPSVITINITDITPATASGGGVVTSDGGAAVAARGVCWSTTQNPSISDNHTINGSGTGSFTSDITGLSANTRYFVRAYGTNSAGIAYGDTVGFTTTEAMQLPSVITAPITNLNQTTVTGGGNVTSQGGSPVTFRGVCWSTSQDPTISDNHTTDGYGIGVFISSIAGLAAGTPYYARAYAMNGAGVAYGGAVSFTTLGLQLPVVITSTVGNITPATAVGGGNVTSDGGSPVTSRGVCWSTQINPTISDNHTTDGSGTGSFTSYLTGLIPETPYFARAYASSNVGTAYGENQPFNSGGFPLLNVPGNYQGWNPADSSTVVSSFNSDDTYEGYIWFPVNTEFKYARGTWAENWGDNNGDGTLEPNGANIFAPVAGYYKLNANLNNLTHTFVSTAWSVIGSATPGGPNNDIDMSYNDNTKIWTVTINLAAGEFKFRANHSWTINYGDDGANMTLEQNGAGIAIGAPGNYTINLYLGLSIYRYTAIKN